MKKQAVLYGALALVGYLLFVVVLTPADRVYALLKEKMPVALFQLDGSIWDGSAGVATFGRQQRVEALNWSVEPAALLLGRAQAEVTFNYDQQKISGVVGHSLGGPFLEAVKGRLAGSTVERFSPQLAIGLNGLFQIDLDRAALTGGQLSEIDGTIRWRDAGLKLNNTALGNFELVLTTGDGRIDGVVRDLDGPLKVNGTLQLQPGGDYTFAGTIELRDTQRNDLRQGLRFVGTPNSKGVYTVKHQGRLPLEKLAGSAG